MNSFLLKVKDDGVTFCGGSILSFLWDASAALEIKPELNEIQRNLPTNEVKSFQDSAIPET